MFFPMCGTSAAGRVSVCAAALAVVLCGLLLWNVQSAQATVPGRNGRIVFSSFGELYTVLPDGSDLTRVPMPSQDVVGTDFSPAWSPDGTRIAFAGEVFGPPNFPGGFPTQSQPGLELLSPAGTGFLRLNLPNPYATVEPVWSPDGSRIAYYSGTSIYSAAPDGSGERLLVDGGSNSPGAFDAAWSPDGQWIVFAQVVDAYGETELFTMRSDGTDVRRLLQRPGLDLQPSWSPDGRTIVFAGSDPRDGTDVSWSWPNRNIFEVPATGGTPVQLTSSGSDSDPAWSPDGREIVFQSYRPNTYEVGNADLYLMNADGSDQRRLTTIGCWSCGPDWQSIPIPPPPPPTPPVTTLPVTTPPPPTPQAGGMTTPSPTPEQQAAVPAGPHTATHAVDITVATHTATVDRRGAVALTIACGAAAPCEGTLSLYFAHRLANGHVRLLVLAHRRVREHADEHARVVLLLDRLGRRLLAHASGGRLRVRASLVRTAQSIVLERAWA
jgi:Tol biopolymer transport system component